MTYTFVFQKTCGIIALLDEAWYVIRDKTVMQLLLLPSISFMKQLIYLVITITFFNVLYLFSFSMYCS
jgi:hypothetical protein